VFINPATYAVDGLRWALVGMHHFDPLADFAVVTLFAAVMIGIGTVAFKKMRI
jgi:ABC-2 type transport system permease protein